MVKPTHLQRNGNGFLVLMDDGTRYRAIRDGAGQYLIGDAGGDVDPPDPTGDWFHPLGGPWPWTTYEDGGGSHSAGALDFPCGSDTPPLYAACDGEVIRAGWEDGGGGNVVIVRGPDGEGITYAHLSRIDVTVGQTVAGGSVVGLVGMTGTASGNHLHLEVRINGTNWGPWYRALDYFASKGIDLGPQA